MIKLLNNTKKMAQLDSNFAFLEQYSIGWIYLDLKDYDQAFKHIKQAQEIDPFNYLVYRQLAAYSWHVQDYKQVVRNYEKIAQLKEHDPYNISNAAVANELFADKGIALKYMTKAAEFEKAWLVDLGMFYLHRGEFDKGISVLEQYVDFDARLRLAYARLMKNQYQLAAVEFEEALKELNFTKGTDIYNRVFSDGNFNIKTLRKYINNVFNELAYSFLNHPIYKSYFYAALGEVDSAFVNINKALEEDSPIWIYYLIMRSPAMEKLKADPRYDALIKRLKLEEYL